MGRLFLAALALLTLACSDPAPPAPEVVAPPEEPEPEPPLVGRFEGERLCLVLLANGDVELILSHRPKVLVVGRGAIEGETLRLEVDRIWAGRYLSRCREHHESGHFEETARALGLELRPGTTAEFRVERKSAETIRLCARENCETLSRAPLRLPTRWVSGARPGHVSGRDEAEPGTLMQLQLGEHATLQYARAERMLGSVYGQVTIEPTNDGFVVTFRAERVDALDVSVLGRPLTEGSERRFVIRRLAGQRIAIRSEGCDEPACAAELDRDFDRNGYGVE